MSEPTDTVDPSRYQHETGWYRNRGPLPIPGGWVIGRAEQDHFEWLHFGERGVDETINADVQHQFQVGDPAYHDALDNRARLSVDGDRWEFSIGVETGFAVDVVDAETWERVEGRLVDATEFAEAVAETETAGEETPSASRDASSTGTTLGDFA